MTSDQFVAEIRAIIAREKLTPAQAASALAGIVVSICVKHGLDPHEYIEWVIQEALKIRSKVRS